MSGQGLSALLESGEPELGRKYFLEDATDGTLAQNKLFHALIGIWEDAETATFPAGNGTFKEKVKLYLGQGFESFLYWNGEKLIKVKKRTDIPEEIRTDRDRCFGSLKSWSDYTLKHRKQCIDKVIRQMLRDGFSSKKFDEILKEIGWTE